MTCFLAVSAKSRATGVLSMVRSLANGTTEFGVISGVSSGEDKFGGSWEVLSKLWLHIEKIC